MTLTWLGILALVILVIFCVLGFRKGFVKEVVSVFFVIVSLVLVWAVNPYVNSFLREKTPVYEKIRTSCQELVTRKAGDSLGLDSTEQESGSFSLNSTQQENVLEQLNLPTIITDSLLKNNNARTYVYLAANSFVDYVSDYLTVTLVNGLSFLLSWLLVRILIRAAVALLNILTMLPVVHGVNKISGAVLGAAKGVLFLWIALLVITVLCSTEIGKQAMALVGKDYFLSFLYSHDFLVNVFMSVFYGS